MAEGTFVLPGFAVPAELISPPFRLEPLGPQHNDADYAAWMSSIEHISGTPGFIGRDWPDPEMSPEDNLADLRGHADDFARRAGFTYTVIEISSGEIIGCVYIYPPGGEDQDPADGQDHDPPGGEDHDPADGRDQSPPGGEDQDPADGQDHDPPGGEDQDPADGQDHDPPGGEDQDPAGGALREPAGGGDHDAAVSSWVRADRASLDAALYEAVSAWLAAAWPFRAVSYAPR
jgi:hypothetical protein